MAEQTLPTSLRATWSPPSSLLGFGASSDSIRILESIIKNRKQFQSDIDDYLPNLSVGFEEARRFLDLFKRERARDDWLQLPRREPLGDESFCTLESSVVVRDLSIQITLQRQALA